MKDICVDTCTALLQWCATKRGEFLQCTVIDNKSWVHYFQPETV